jgi:NHL repeat
VSTASCLASAVRMLRVALAGVLARVWGGSGALAGVRASRAGVVASLLSAGVLLIAPSLAWVRRIGLAACAVTAGLFWLGSSPAWAANIHVFSSSFGSQGSAAGQVSAPQGVAVNDTTGDVYVADTGNARVDEFSSSGTFIRSWGWGVADGASSFETCTTTCQPGVSGSGAGQFTTPAFIAVDNSAGSSAGDVYVADTGDRLVSKFDASGNLISGWGNHSPSNGQLSGASSSGGPFAGLTVDGSGNLWAYDLNSTMFEFGQAGGFIQSWNSGRGTLAGGLAADASGNLYLLTNAPGVTQFTSAGVQVGDIDNSYSNVTGVAVDPTGPDLYVDDGGTIHHYDSSCSPAVGCTPSDLFGSSNLSGGAAGLAVNPASDTVYVADPSANLVDVFAGELVPDVADTPATGVQTTSATLNGTVNPDGIALKTSGGCQFEYGTDPTYGTTVPCAQSSATIGSGSSPVPVSVAVTSLQPNTTYHYRVDAANANGSNQSADGTFTTPAPPAVDGESTASVTRTGASLQAQVNPNGLDTTYHFEYGSAGPCSSSPCTSVPVHDADIGSAFGDQAVSQHITGLQLNTTYHYRVVATNSANVTDGPDQTFTTQPIATILGEGTVNVAPDRALLESAVDVFGTSTTYHFQYGTSTGYGSSVPVPDGTLGTGPDPQEATDALTGLSPSTTYHFRIVATNSFGTVTGADETFATPAASPCPNAQFRIGLSAGLPDCRAYEQVSPPDKNGGGVALYSGGFTPLIQISQASTTGNGIVYASQASFAGGQSATFISAYLASRTSGGGLTQGIGAPQNAQPRVSADAQYPAFSPDLSIGVLHDEDVNGPLLAPGAVLGYDNLYLRDNTSATYHALTTVKPPNVAAGSSQYEPLYQGASADFSHVIFLAQDALTPNAQVPSCPNCYNLYESIGGQLRLVNVLPDGTSTTDAGAGGHPFFSTYDEGNLTNAISADGQRIYWTDNSDNPGNIYVRLNGQTTVPVGNGLFWAASSDGSKAIYTSDPNSPNLDGGDLYEFDLSTGRSTDLTPGGQMQGLLGASKDLSSIYFVANAVLATGATAGQSNVYLDHDGAIRFIATVTGPDGNNGSQFSIDNRFPGRRLSYVTPDGEHAAFVSSASLTGYDNTDAVTGQPDSEVYVYDATTNTLSCASCNPSGAKPIGSSSITPWATENYDPRAVSDDGQRVFFNSSDALVPRDSNGQQGVYEYDHGAVHLISSGTSGASDSFVDASPTGNDVFFITSQQLVPQDSDNQFDLYDARVGGGFPYSPPAAPCIGDACLPPPNGSPPTPTAASVTFAGPGDASPPGAAIAKVEMLSRVVRGSTFLVAVKVPGKGRVTISGAGIKTVRKLVSKAGTYRLRVTLTAEEKKALKRKGNLKLGLRVAYAPAGGQTQTATVRITVKPALRRTKIRPASSHQGGAR